MQTLKMLWQTFYQNQSLEETHELFHSGEKYKGGEKPICINVSSETSTQALWLCFRWKPLFLASFCNTLEQSLRDSPFKRYTRLTKQILMWNMWEGFHSSFKPAQAYMVINVGGKQLNWTQLVWIVAPVWSKRLSWKVTRCCTGKKFVKCHISGKYFYAASLRHHNFSNVFSCSSQRK